MADNLFHLVNSMKKPVKIILACLIVVLVAVFGYSAYRVTHTLHQYNESARYYEKTRQSAVAVDPEKHADPTAQQPQEIEKTEKSPITVDFDALKAINPDIRGWLYSEGTKINYPVVQARDNAYYLYRLMDGSYNPGGTLFMDYRCQSDFGSKNTIIYGHHMQDGSMLASLVNYGKQAYYDEHPVMYLNTPDGDYRLEIFAGFVTWYDSRVYMYDFSSRTEFDEWVELMRSYSDFSCDVEVNQEDFLITLSTCTYDYDNARYVVLARMVPLNG